MKYLKFLCFVFAVAMVVFCAAGAVMAQNGTLIYKDQGGTTQTVASGGLVDVLSGGEIDINSGATLDVNGTVDLTGATVTSLGSVAADNPGRGSITICGDATTVNNNTVYYGPDPALHFSSTSDKFAAPGGWGCDINAAGSTTEATADAVGYLSQGFYVLGMSVLNEGDANADISYTLRDDEGATTPSVTCTITDGNRNCIADVQTTTAIAAGSALAIAVNSSGDIADGNGFVAKIDIAY